MEFKELTPKKKLEHIWEYYKIHIISLIAIIGVIIWGVNHFILHPEPTVCCGVAVYGPHISVDTVQELENRLTAGIVPQGVNEKAEVTNFFFTEGKSSEDVIQDQDMLNKFYTYLYSLQLDIFIGNKEDTEACIKADFLNPVDKYFGEEEMKAFEDGSRLLYGMGSEDKEEKPYAIKIENSALANELGILNDDEYYIGFVPIEGREETAKKAVEMFVDKK